jgi:hypothetical protein
MKLALGTAQFGLDYGVSNKQGQVNLEEVRSILELAKKAGIKTVDTAAAYGKSEFSLGMAGIHDFDVITKVPAFPSHSLINIDDWIRKTVTDSLSALKVEELTGLLLHRPLELLNDGGEDAFKTLVDLKKQGIVKKIGISIYHPQDLDALLPRFRFDIVQTPLNILDRRLISSGWLDRLKQDGVEIHTRSAFLQGLLLMHPQDRPDYFLPWEKVLTQFDLWREYQGLTALQACLTFLYQLENVDKVIVGTESVQQLLEIIQVDQYSELILSNELATEDDELINPARWRL